MRNNRLIYLALFTGCIVLLGFGLYLEHGKGIEPCPLCIFQRIAYIAIALVTLLGALYLPGRRTHLFYSLLTGILSLVGAGIAGRQVWLQHLPPDQVPECGPGLDYMLDVFPFTDVLAMVFTGSGECAEVHWQFLGMSIAEWSLLCFILILLTAIFNIRVNK